MLPVAIVACANVAEAGMVETAELPKPHMSVPGVLDLIDGIAWSCKISLRGANMA